MRRKPAAGLSWTAHLPEALRRCTLAQGAVMISRKPSSELSSLYCTVINAILLLLQSPCPRNGPRAWSPYQLQPPAASDKWAIDIVKKLTHLSYIAWHGCLNECSKGGGSECSAGTTLHSHIICQQNKSSCEIHLTSTRAWEASIMCCRLQTALHKVQHIHTNASLACLLVMHSGCRHGTLKRQAVQSATSTSTRRNR